MCFLNVQKPTKHMLKQVLLHKHHLDQLCDGCTPNMQSSFFLGLFSVHCFRQRFSLGLQLADIMNAPSGCTCCWWLSLSQTGCLFGMVFRCLNPSIIVCSYEEQYQRSSGLARLRCVENVFHLTAAHY